MSFKLKSIFVRTSPPDIADQGTVTLREYFDDTVCRIAEINREEKKKFQGGDHGLTSRKEVARALLYSAREKFRIEREMPDPGRIEPIKPAQALIDRCDDLREQYGLPAAPVVYERGDTRRIMAAHGIYVLFPLPVNPSLEGTYERAAQGRLSAPTPMRPETGPAALREYFVKTIDHIATSLAEDPGMEDDGVSSDVSPSRIAREMLEEADALSRDASLSHEAALMRVCDKHRAEIGLPPALEVHYLEGDLNRARETKAREYQPGITLMY